MVRPRLMGMGTLLRGMGHQGSLPGTNVVEPVCVVTQVLSSLTRSLLALWIHALEVLC